MYIITFMRKRAAFLMDERGRSGSEVQIDGVFLFKGCICSSRIKKKQVVEGLYVTDPTIINL